MKFNKILLTYSGKQTDNHLQTLSDVKKILSNLQKDFSSKKVDKLIDADFKNIDLVITIGGDGTFIIASYFIQDTPILGINSDPESSAGALTNLDSYELNKLNTILQGEYRIIQKQRAQITKNNQKIKELVSNEVYIGSQDHFHTSRYIVELNGQKEEHRSSGVLISTGVGSSAWYKSAGGDPFHPSSEKLMMLVREPIKNRVFNPKILNSEIKKGEKIIFESTNRNKGVIAIDGNKIYKFDFGDVVEISLSEQKLNVIEKNILPSKQRIDQNKKVALFGGSFNPIHNAHIQMIKKIIDSKIVDEVWIIPCKVHAFNKKLLPINQRIEMIKEAINNMSKVKIDLTEIDTIGVNYTFDTIKKIQEKFPHKFYLFIGADLDLTKWYRYPELLQEIEFILHTRENYEFVKLKDLDIYKKFNNNAESISSTDIRERIKLNKKINNLVDTNVEKYISENNLYKK